VADLVSDQSVGCRDPMPNAVTLIEDAAGRIADIS
jgi:hypothetical protein